MKEKHEHNFIMVEIASSLTDFEFEDIKTCAIVKQMWDQLRIVYGGDANILKAKVEKL